MMTKNQASLKSDSCEAGEPHHPGAPTRQPMFYGWLIVAAAFATQAIMWGFRIQVFGLFLKAVNDERGWAPAATAAVFSVSMLCNSLLGPVIGRIVDRRGPKTVMLPGALLAIVGMLLFSQVREVWQFYLFYGVIYGVGETLLGAVPASTVVSKWFVRKRGSALGIVAMASNVGGFVMLPLCTFFITYWGWRMATLVPIVLIVLLAIPSSLVMRRRPEDMGLRPDGDPPRDDTTSSPRSNEGSGDPDWTLRDALRTRAFWCLGISWGLSLASGLNYSTYVFSFTAEAGISVSTVASALSMILLLALPVRFFYGWLSDRLDKRLVVISYEVGLLIGYLSLTQLGAPFMLYVSLIFYAFSAGAMQSVPQNMAADLFGRKSLGTVLGTLTLIATLVVAAAIPLTGLVRQETGSYSAVFLAFPVALVVAMLAIYFSRHVAQPALGKREVTS